MQLDIVVREFDNFCWLSILINNHFYTNYAFPDPTTNQQVFAPSITLQ